MKLTQGCRLPIVDSVRTTPFILSILLASSAYAAPSSRGTAVGILPVEIGGYLPKRDLWQTEFALRLAEEAKRAKFATHRADLLDEAERRCTDATCADAIAARLGVDALIRARVMASPKPPPEYRIEVWLY